MDTELLSKGMVHLALRPHETFFMLYYSIQWIFSKDDGPLEGNR